MDEMDKAIRTLRLMESNLKSLLQRKKEELDRINTDEHLTVKEGLKSLNLVKVV